MTTPRVLIDYKPRIYTDLFKSIFQSIGRVEIVEVTTWECENNSDGVDVIVLSLNTHGQPESDLPLEQLQNAKVIAFSPKGDYGLRRLPGENAWEEVSPFSLEQLIEEVLNVPHAGG